MSEQAPERLLPMRAVRDQVALHPATVYAMIKAGEFPQPIKMGRRSLWIESEVQAWISRTAEAMRAKARLTPYKRGPKVRTALYRHFDKDSRLLYIGISLSAVERLREHRVHASWFDRIVRIEIEWFQSRGAALNAERRAIMREKPECNIIHNGRPVPAGEVAPDEI